MQTGQEHPMTRFGVTAFNKEQKDCIISFRRQNDK